MRRRGERRNTEKARYEDTETLREAKHGDAGRGDGDAELKEVSLSLEGQQLAQRKRAMLSSRPFACAHSRPACVRTRIGRAKIAKFFCLFQSQCSSWRPVCRKGQGQASASLREYACVVHRSCGGSVLVQQERARFTHDCQRAGDEEPVVLIKAGACGG